MHIYGLTGGISSGKSTVSRYLQSLGVPVIDADIIARQSERENIIHCILVLESSLRK